MDRRTVSVPLTTSKRIPVAAPDLSGNEEAYVMECIRSTWISSKGKFIDQFEENFSTLVGARSTIGVANGTLALHLALLALDVRPGDEVLVPSLTYVATANAVRYVGAEPVFVDVDPNTWCMDATLLESKITRRTRGIIPVHLYGHPADMDAINHVAAIHGLWVVEDCAEALLGTYKGRPVGSLATIGTFSFYGNKLITSGEGGAVTVSDAQLDLRLRTLRGQGVDPERRYYFPVTGHNFRITNVACALLCAQLERIRDLYDARHTLYKEYERLLSDVPGLGFQPVADYATISPWLFCITVDEAEFGHCRDDVMAHLDRAGIETRPFFMPLHRLPPFREEAQSRGDHLPVTDRLSQTGMNLPTYPSLSLEDQGLIAAQIRALHNSVSS
jgi:perosamine synthetase